MLDVKVKDWSIRDYQANKSMTFHLYNGEVSVQIRDTANRQQQQGSNKPIFYRPLSSYKLEFLKRTIEKIISASPEPSSGMIWCSQTGISEGRGLGRAEASARFHASSAAEAS